MMQSGQRDNGILFAAVISGIEAHGRLTEEGAEEGLTHGEPSGGIEAYLKPARANLLYS
jgi:hypothetical protein